MSKNKTETWNEYYEKKLARTDIHKEIIRKSNTRIDTIEAIIESSEKRGKILEAGCGTSTLSIILNKKGYQNYCIDNNEKMYEIAKQSNKEAGTKVQYYLGSIFDLPFPDQAFDAVFSHGVLEHFDEKKIIEAIDEGLRVAKTYIVSFPTIIGKGHPALYGDENLWSYFHWKKIISHSSGYVSRAYSMFPKDTTKGFLNRLLRKKLYYISSELGFIIKAK